MTSQSKKIEEPSKDNQTNNSLSKFGLYKEQKSSRLSLIRSGGKLFLQLFRRQNDRKKKDDFQYVL